MINSEINSKGYMLTGSKSGQEVIAKKGNGYWFIKYTSNGRINNNFKSYNEIVKFLTKKWSV